MASLLGTFIKYHVLSLTKFSQKVGNQNKLASHIELPLHKMDDITLFWMTSPVFQPLKKKPGPVHGTMALLVWKPTLIMKGKTSAAVAYPKGLRGIVHSKKYQSVPKGGLDHEYGGACPSVKWSLWPVSFGVEKGHEECQLTRHLGR